MREASLGQFRALSALPLPVRWLNSIQLDDVRLVGGKNASLGVLYSALGRAGVRLPSGFALAAAAYRDALKQADSWPALHALLDGLDVTDVATLAGRARQASIAPKEPALCALRSPSPIAFWKPSTVQTLPSPWWSAPVAAQ